MDAPKNFTEWLTKHYKAWTDQKQTLSGWAAWLDVDQNVLSRWLGGKDEPKLDDVHKLADALDSDIYELLGLENPKDLK